MQALLGGVLKKILLALFVVLIGLLPVALALTQEQPGVNIQISGINPTDLPTINTTAVVLDKLGQPSTGLTAENFEITGELADIASIVSVTSVADENLPVSVVLVVDVSSSMTDAPINQARAAARAFVENIGPDDPVAIVTFSNTAQVIQDFTSDKDVLLQAIDSIRAGGETQLYAGALLAAETAAEAPTPRRAVILLSDGAQYSTLGPAAPRPSALTEAIARGVPFYTVGLGFGTDRTYLTEIAEGTNALFRESPRPEELPTIYQELATRLRTQYEVIINADIPADGTIYSLELQVVTDAGASIAIADLRAPVPVPIVRIGEIAGPLETATTVEIEVAADDPLQQVDFLLDDAPLADVTQNENIYSITLDPMTLTPGTHTLAVSAVDEDNETGTAAVDFEVSALPSVVTLEPELPAEELSEAQTFAVNISGQTAVTEASYSVDGAAAVNLDDTGITIVPGTLAPGTHRLAVTVTNEGGITSTSEYNFAVAEIPPTFTVRGLEAGQTINEPVEVLVDILTSQSPDINLSFALNGSPVEDQGRAPGALILEPMALTPGNNTLTVTVTNGLEQTTSQDITFTVAAIPPVISISGLSAGETLEDDLAISIEAESQTPITSVTYRLDDTTLTAAEATSLELNLDILELAPGPHILTVEVTDSSGQTGSADVAFVVAEGPSLTATALAPTATPTITTTPSPTFTPTVDLTATAVQEAALLQATRDIESTADAVIAEETSAAQALVATGEAVATLNTRATSNASAQGTRDAQATERVAATSTAAIVNTATTEAEIVDQSTATAAALVAAEINATNDAQATQNAEATAGMFATENAMEQATVDARATIDLIETANANATVVAEAEAGTATAAAEALAQATIDEQATADAEASLTAQVTSDSGATATAAADATESAQIALAATEAQSATDEVTEEAEPPVTPTDEPPTEIAQVEASATAEPEDDEPTATPTITPTLILAEAESAPETDSTVPIILIIVFVLILLLVIFLLLSRGRRDRQNRR